MNRGSHESDWRRVGVLARLILAGVLGLASVGKAIEPETFLGFLEEVTGSGGGTMRLVVVLLVSAEAGLAAMLLLMGRYSYVYLAICLLFIALGGTLLYAIVIDLDTTVGCFGSYLEAETANMGTVIRYMLLATVSLGMALHYQVDSVEQE